jgi:hypothetical protein
LEIFLFLVLFINQTIPQEKPITKQVVDHAMLSMLKSRVTRESMKPNSARTKPPIANVGIILVSSSDPDDIIFFPV